MKKRINEWLFKKAKKFIAKKINHSENLLTPKYLIDKGWVEKDGYYIEENIKDRDRISISFEITRLKSFYRVWHSEKRTFIALESTIEWFEVYYLLAHQDNR